MLSDSDLFPRREGWNLYEVSDQVMTPGYEAGAMSPGGVGDSLCDLLLARMLESDLDQAGQQLMQEHFRTDWASWVPILPLGDEFDMSDAITLRAAYVASCHDSLYFVCCFEARSAAVPESKCYLHLHGDFGFETFLNRDFLPSPPPADWQSGDLVFCARTLGQQYASLQLSLGFFRSDERFGRSFSGQYRSPLSRD